MRSTFAFLSYISLFDCFGSLVCLCDFDVWLTFTLLDYSCLSFFIYFFCSFNQSLFAYNEATFVIVLTEPVVLPPILPGQALAVPLHLTSWRLQARPKGLGLFFCKVPIHWTSVERPGEISSSKRECQSADFDNLKHNFR